MNTLSSVPFSPREGPVIMLPFSMIGDIKTVTRLVERRWPWSVRCGPWSVRCGHLHGRSERGERTRRLVWTTCCHFIVQLCLTLCSPMDCSTPGCPVLHHLLEFAHICELSLWQIVFLGCMCLETPHLFSARLSMEVTHGVMRHPDGDADPRETPASHDHS